MGYMRKKEEGERERKKEEERGEREGDRCICTDDNVNGTQNLQIEDGGDGIKSMGESVYASNQ